MSERKIVRVADVMKPNFDLVEGRLTVKEALLAMKHPETRVLVVAKRHEDDEYGIVLLSEIAKKVIAANRAPERVNLYEVMAKPVFSVPPEMQIRYCARLLQNFGIALAPVISEGKVLGIVSYNDLVLRGLMRTFEEA
jgi:predicted transcriptional regulator